MARLRVRAGDNVMSMEVLTKIEVQGCVCAPARVCVCICEFLNMLLAKQKSSEVN